MATLTKNPAFATNFFKKYIYGAEKNDYTSLLLNAGLVLRKANPDKAYTGFGRVTAENGKVILPQTLIGTPAYQAGLDVDDVILTIDGKEIKDVETVNTITDAHKPGDVVPISYLYRGEEKTTRLIFTENPTLEIIPIEKNRRNFNPSDAKF